MSGPKILLVDDDHAILEIIGELLESYGFDVIRAQDSESAIEILKGIKVQGVLSDIMMPGMSGLTLAQRLAKSQPNVPIVIYTGADFSDFPTLNLNIRAVLTKPAAPALLVETLKRAIAEYDKTHQISMKSN